MSRVEKLKRRADWAASATAVFSILEKYDHPGDVLGVLSMVLSYVLYTMDGDDNARMEELYDGSLRDLVFSMVEMGQENAGKPGEIH